MQKPNASLVPMGLGTRLAKCQNRERVQITEQNQLSMTDLLQAFLPTL